MGNNVVFVSSGALSESASKLLVKRLQKSMPEHEVVYLPPGVALSNPFDVSALCEAVSKLVEVNQQLLASNQEMLAEIIEMYQEAEEVTNPEHHLGMSSLG